MINEITVVGLCGRSGSGKGYVSSVFAMFGIPSIDTDKVYRDMVSDENRGSPCLKELEKEFGKGIINENGGLDRQTLSSIVFAKGNESLLKKLNEITHKYILIDTIRIIERLKNDGFKSVIVDAPVLFESGFNSICQLTVCVTAPEHILVNRICLRDGRLPEQARERLNSQKSEEELLKLCNEAIVNDGKSSIEYQVSAIIEKYGLEGKYGI